MLASHQRDCTGHATGIGGRKRETVVAQGTESAGNIASQAFRDWSRAWLAHARIGVVTRATHNAMSGIRTGETAVHGSPAAEAFGVGGVVVETGIAAQAGRDRCGALGTADVAGRAGASGSGCECVSECTTQTIRGRCLASRAGMGAGRTSGRRTQEVPNIASQTIGCIVTGRTLRNGRATETGSSGISRQVESLNTRSAGGRRGRCAGEAVVGAERTILRIEIVAGLASGALGG